MKLIYLACPYSHESPAIRHARFVAANCWSVKLIEKGYLVFSPISHSHPICEEAEGSIGYCFEYWAAFDKRMIAACDELWVLHLDGWEKSTDIKSEMKLAKQLLKPIRHLEP